MLSVNKSIRISAWFLAAVLLLSTALLAYSGTVYAATPKLDKIRVALFIQTRDMAPAVTLSINSQAQIGLRAPEGIRNWLTVDSGSPVRFSVDQYRILLLETDNVNTARSAAAQITTAMNARERAFVLGVPRNGTTIYQVVAGNYSNLQEAVSAQDRLLAHAAVAPVVSGFTTKILGPHHLSAGSYATKTEAEAVAGLYHQAGIHASLVYHENSDKQLLYAVWVGEESTPEQLESMKTQALAVVPGFSLSTIDGNQPYLYTRLDYTDAQPIPHYYYNANNQKVWFSAASPGIKVQERFGRTYRGSMELTQHNGRLALINEVPFEQYLYAVVSNEMGGGFPSEALKAQAVAARTFALQQGMKYGIAHISDTVYDQAYYGYGSESSAAVQAVDATASEVVVNRSDSSLITPFYSSNSGGFTSETDEVWGTAVRYLHSVPSPDDVAERGRYNWYRVVLPGHQVGYIREDLVTAAGKTAVGLQILTVNDNNVNVRPSPDTSGSAITQLQSGDRLIAVETVKESNPYSWISSTWTADSLLTRINQYARTPIAAPLTSLTVTKRGMSGRVITINANGSQNLDVSYPDAFRTVLGGLRSTRFDIDQTNDITILGANGQTVNIKSSNSKLHVISGTSAQSVQTLQGQGNYVYMMNKDQKVRVGTLDPQYRFVGRGYGHGLGMSQYGAMALAELGYDYKRILQYYYKDVNVIKG